MGQLLENTEVWMSVQADLNRMSLVEVAAKHGVKAGSIAAAMRRTGTQRQVRIEEDVALPPEPEDAGGSGSASKQHLMEPYRGLLGKESDSVIAKKAGVSARTVAAYRMRLKIPGYNRWSDPKRSRTQKRRSKLDPFRDLVGTVTDATVAKKANVSIQAVRNYRVKHGIPSSRSRARTVQKSGAEVRHVSTVGQGTETAWKISFEGPRGQEVRIGFAASLGEVIERAAVSGLGEIIQIEKLGLRL
jgi:hypothetical protein